MNLLEKMVWAAAMSQMLGRQSQLVFLEQRRGSDESQNRRYHIRWHKRACNGDS